VTTAGFRDPGSSRSLPPYVFSYKQSHAAIRRAAAQVMRPSLVVPIVRLADLEPGKKIAG
jgi:hypothetical protein